MKSYIKQTRIMLAAALAAMIALLAIQCAGSGDDFNNPLDKNGTNYLYGDTTNESEKIKEVDGVSGLYRKYTVSFNVNGGSGTVSSQSVQVGKSVTLPSDNSLSRSGYTFDGWNTQSNGSGTNYDAGSSYTPTANITIYAQWTLITYTLTINRAPANGGTTSPASSQSNIASGTAVNISATANSDYTFNNWTLTSGTATFGNVGSAATTVTLSANATIQANFSTSGGGIVPGPDVGYSGETYKTVRIGNQTWFARNLNYNASGSVCIGNRDESCAQYGRLYNWSTAMGIAASYNTSYWNGSDVKHQGICPAGWHLPSDAEWETLENAVGGSSTAGTKLKSTSGWYIYSGTPAGTDNYGFSALPGGFRLPDGDFYNVGTSGNWWSATERDADYAWLRDIDPNYEYVRSWYDINIMSVGRYGKTALLSVRCVQDGGTTPTPTTYTLTVNRSPTNGGTTSPASFQANIASGTAVNISATANSGYTFNNWTVTIGTASFGNANSASTTVTLSANATIQANFNTFTDSRDSKTYKRVQIGTQWWMAENLNYNASGSVCYRNIDENCAKYGRLYDGSTAMGGASSSSASPSGVRGVCPVGWHLPSDAEWTQLENAVGGSSVAGKKLKSTSGWNWNYEDGISGNGTDDFGFSALPGGGIFGQQGSIGAGSDGWWWSATEAEDVVSFVWYRFMSNNNEYVLRNNNYFKEVLISVRCVKD